MNANLSSEQGDKLQAVGKEPPSLRVLDDEDGRNSRPE